MPEAVVMFSGGVSSWAAAKRTAAKYGSKGAELVAIGQLPLGASA
jgi:PP-loop superfamily ATP-utilizing enzyme